MRTDSVPPLYSSDNFSKLFVNKFPITQLQEIGLNFKNNGNFINDEENSAPEISLSTLGQVASEVSSHGFSHVVIAGSSESKLSKFDHEKSVLEISASIKSTLSAKKLLVDQPNDLDKRSIPAALINTLLSAVFTGKTQIEISNLESKKGARIEIDREPYGNGFFMVRKICIFYEVEYGTIKASAEFSRDLKSSEMNILIEVPEGYASKIGESTKELQLALNKKRISANVSCR